MKSNSVEKGQFVTISELAKALGISRVAVYKKIKKGEIKATMVGNIYLIPKAQVSEIFGHTLSSKRKHLIDKAVHKAVKDYGEVLIKLGNE